MSALAALEHSKVLRIEISIFHQRLHSFLIISKHKLIAASSTPAQYLE
jgi:hypothetical protein